MKKRVIFQGTQYPQNQTILYMVFLFYAKISKSIITLNSTYDFDMTILLTLSMLLIIMRKFRIKLGYSEPQT